MPDLSGERPDPAARERIVLALPVSPGVIASLSIRSARGRPSTRSSAMATDELRSAEAEVRAELARLRAGDDPAQTETARLRAENARLQDALRDAMRTADRARDLEAALVGIRDAWNLPYADTARILESVKTAMQVLDGTDDEDGDHD